MKTALLAPICLLLVVLTAKTSAYLDNCPPAGSILPCTCVSVRAEYYLYCSDKRMNDSKLSEILQFLLENKISNKLFGLYATDNSLTRIPEEISQFESLSHILLDHNQITSIPYNAFDFPYPSTVPSGYFRINLSNNDITSIDDRAFYFGASHKHIEIALENNEIATISDIAFQGLGAYKMIDFSNNGIQILEEYVFYPILSWMNERNSTYERHNFLAAEGIRLYGNGVESCSTYNWKGLCQMAWLLRDNRHLLKYIDEGNFECASNLDAKPTDFDMKCNSSGNDDNIDDSN